MTTDAANVHVAVAGELYRAPLGTALPTDAQTTLAAAYTGLGYVSNDGVDEGNADSVTDIVAWQNATTVRSTTTESTTSLGLTLIETKGTVLETFHRGSTMTEVAADNFRLDVKPVIAVPLVWVLNVVDGSIPFRIVIGRGEIVERGSVMYANGQPMAYPMTIRCYPDDNGNLMQKFSSDTAWSAS